MFAQPTLQRPPFRLLLRDGQGALVGASGLRQRITDHQIKIALEHQRTIPDQPHPALGSRDQSLGVHC